MSMDKLCSKVLLRPDDMYAIPTGCLIASSGLTSSVVYVKKYTEDHEWIEMDTDGVTGTTPTGFEV
jgi:hypothetical protein